MPSPSLQPKGDNSTKPCAIMPVARIAAARELADVDAELARLQAGGTADTALPELASTVAQAQSNIEAAEAATVRAEAAHSAAPTGP